MHSRSLASPHGKPFASRRANLVPLFLLGGGLLFPPVPRLAAEVITVDDRTTSFPSPTVSAGRIVNQSGGTWTNASTQVFGAYHSFYDRYDGIYNLSGGAAEFQTLILGQFSGPANFGYPAAIGYASITGGTLKVTYQLHLGASLGVGEINQSGGLVQVNELLITSGTSSVTDAGRFRHSSGRYSLRGGVLEAGAISKTTNHTAFSMFYFDGGTLRATAHNDNYINNGLQILVGPGGAIIDSNGFNVNLPFLTHDPGDFLFDGGLVKKGNGTLTISDGDTTHIGGTQVQAGALAIGAGYNTGMISGLVNVSANATLSFNRNDTATFDGIIFGAGNLENWGTGTLVLNSPHAFTGITRVTKGTLRLDHPDAIAASTLTHHQADLGTLSFGNLTTATLGGLSGVRALALANASSAPVALAVGANQASTTFSGALTGTGSLTKVGTGTLTLSGANTHTGGTTVNAGTLALTHIDSFGINGVGGMNGPLHVAGGATLDTTAINATANNTASLHVSSLSGSGSIAMGNGFLVANQAADTTWSGVLSGTGRLRKLGSGTLTLTGLNTYAAATFFNEGTIQFQQLANFGPTGLLRFQGGTIRWAPGNTADLSSRGVWIESGDSTFDTNGNDVTLANAIGNALPGALTKAGSGTLTLAGDNTYTGGTTISGGTLQLGNGGTSGSVAGNLANHAALVWNRSDASTFARVLSGPGTFTKTGAGTLTLSGDNSPTGPLTLAAGTLAVAHPGALGSTGLLHFTGGTLQHTPANTTDYSSRFATAANQAYRLDTNGQNITLATALNSTGGSLTKLGAGTLTLSAANTFTGATRITSGTLRLAHADALAGSTLQHQTSDAGALDFGALTGAKLGGLAGDKNLTLANSTSAPVTLTVGANHAATTYTGGLSGPGSLVKTGTGTLTLAGNSSHTGGTTVSAGTLAATHANALGVNGSLTLAAGATLDTTALADFSVGSLSGAGEIRAGGGVFATTQSGDTTFAGVLSGAGRLAMNGTGTLTLTGNNTFAAATFANAGTLVFSNLNNLGQGANFQFNGGTLKWAAGNTADLSAKFVYLNTGGGVVDTHGNHVTFANPIGTLANGVVGTGALTKTGAGTLVLAGDNTYTGATTVSAGTLQLGAGGASGSVVGDILNQAALVWNRSNSATFARIISGPGRFTKTGSGTLTLTGAHTYTGATTVDAGTLALAQAGQLGATPVTLRAGATLDVSGLSAGEFTLAAGLAGSGTLAASGKTVTVETTLTPGALAVTGHLALAADTTTRFVASATPGASTAVTVNGTLVLKGSVEITPTAGFDFAPGQTLAFATATGGITPGLVGVTVSGVALAETSPDVWTAQNDGLRYTFTESTATLAVSVPVVSPLQAWRDLYFPGEGNDGTGIGADSADPDGDGLANLIEYATHTSPLAAGVSPVVVGRQGEHLTLTFPRIDDPALRYTVEARDDLASGSWTALAPVAANNPTFGFAGSVADQTEIITETVIDPVSLPSRPRRFLRLSIDLVP